MGQRKTDISFIALAFVSFDGLVAKEKPSSHRSLGSMRRLLGLKKP